MFDKRAAEIFPRGFFLSLDRKPHPNSGRLTAKGMLIFR